MKAIGILRVSTEAQQIEDQREELHEFIKNHGYEEIIFIEGVGASAYKLNDKYMYMVQKIKDTIANDKEVKAVFVWHMNRLGRNDAVMMDLKEFFIKNHIQFICKNPYLKLLNDDGSVNMGMELAYSLFSTMSKQEIEERNAKFKRSKKVIAAQGKYIGGHVIPYGYAVDEYGYFVENKEEADLVRLLFQMYSTGKYSSYTLGTELEERGIAISDRQIARILKNEGYLGKPKGEIYGTHYPPIISQELFDKAKEVRDRNKIDMKRGERRLLGAKLVKCPKCGAVCTSNSKHYVCCRGNKGDCENRFAMRQSVADSLLWRVAQTEHLQYLIEMNESSTQDYQDQLKDINEKIEVIKEKIDNFAKKKRRIGENYEDGFIDKKERDLKLSKLESDTNFQKDFMNQLEEKARAITNLIENDKPDTVESFTQAIATMDIESQYDIVHKHIIQLTAKQVSFGKRDPRTHRPNGVEILIETTRGTSYTFLYFPKFYNGFNLYVKSKGKWVPDMYEL